MLSQISQQLFFFLVALQRLHRIPWISILHQWTSLWR